jgi:hypothetical protein
MSKPRWKILLRNMCLTREGKSVPDWYCEISQAASVADLKVLIQMTYPGNPDARMVRLVYLGKMLSQDNEVLCSALSPRSFHELHTLHIIPNYTGFSEPVPDIDHHTPKNRASLRNCYCVQGFSDDVQSECLPFQTESRYFEERACLSQRAQVEPPTHSRKMDSFEGMAHQRACYQYLNFMRRIWIYNQHLQMHQLGISTSRFCFFESIREEQGTLVSIDDSSSQHADQVRQLGRPNELNVSDQQDENRLGNAGRIPGQPENNTHALEQSVISTENIKIIAMVILIVCLAVIMALVPAFIMSMKAVLCLLVLVYFLYCARRIACFYRVIFGAEDQGAGNGGNNLYTADSNVEFPRLNIPATLRSGFLTDLWCMLAAFLFSFCPSWNPVLGDPNEG